ncbi:MAG: hypothetical protein UT17_C0007G0010 [Candidatus Woesebacteria bacterium GW2011_GWB1_39_10]|uniref:Membrane protein 6-pyruvoyl-tetrahydropterin synthase-related domain-containing protein n=1 Tax=Candidatus Woesebacteria bacterium GW2011_GWB1_39_10 TaxID=1618572 RepID=A0A0G0P045_9BACT|nr:MAG: hypothetical protein UT17_C0007G0010 [Candidatus Woesebacteria bacterium GW2011_GWB1_39_10]
MGINMRHTKYYIFSLFIIIILTHWRWLFSSSYFAWGDMQSLVWFNETWQDFVGFPRIWTTLLYGLGQIDISLSQYPLFSAFGVLTSMGIDFRLVTKLIYFIPSAFLPSFCSFLLIRHFTKSNISAFVGSIVYSYNVSILMLQTGLLAFSVVYGLAPLALLVFIKTLESKNIKLSIFTGIVCFVSSIYEFRIFYIISYVLLFYLIFHIFFIERKYDLRSLIRILIYATIPVVMVIALSAYWIVPFIKTGSLTNNVAFSRSLFGNGYMSLKQSVAFFSPWWTAGHGYANGVVQPIPNYFWSIPVLALLGFVLNYKKPRVYFFLFLSFLGILLTKQSDKPFPNLYLWLYQHFPGFNAYREASKFFVILSLGYSVLIAFFIDSLRTRKVLVAIVSVLVSSIFLWNIKPFVTGEIGGLFTPKTRPNDFVILKDFLHKQQDFFRVAWLPASGMWGYFDMTHPKINLHTVYFDTLHQILVSQQDFIVAKNNSKLIGDINHNVFNLFIQNNSNILLDLLNIKYIIIPLEDTQNDDNVFINYGLPDRKYVIDFLNQISYLSPIEIGTKKIAVFENKNYKPLIYLTSQPESIYQLVEHEDVGFKQVNSTLYEISLDNLDKPMFLNFSDSFNTGWKIYVNGRKIKDDYHNDTGGLFNSFYLDPQYIRDNFGTTNNLKITLYFESQKYVYIGTVISLVSLLSVLGLILTLKRND